MSNKYDPVIIGVVKDFHTDSLHTEIEPSAFALFVQTLQRFRRILVKIRPHDYPGSIAQLKKTWKKSYPDKPFSCEFLDAALDRQCRKERNWGRILKYSARAAVLIAWPLAYWAARWRLRDFAYRASVPRWIFAAAAVVGFLTTSYHSVRAASSDPVKIPFLGLPDFDGFRYLSIVFDIFEHTLGTVERSSFAVERPPHL